MTDQFTRHDQVCQKPYAFDFQGAQEIQDLMRKDFLEQKPANLVKNDWTVIERPNGLTERGWYNDQEALQFGLDATVKCDEKDSMYFEFNEQLNLIRVMRINTPNDQKD